MNDSDNRPDQDDEDLLATIRSLVSEEAAREAPIRPEPVPNSFAPADDEADAPAAEPQSAQSRPMPLKLDNPVQAGARPEALAPMYDEEALRSIVTELVRDELDLLMGDALEIRIRKAVRREISRLAARRAEASSES